MIQSPPTEIVARLTESFQSTCSAGEARMSGFCEFSSLQSLAFLQLRSDICENFRCAAMFLLLQGFR
eukprot:1335376-Rhodomonas_salina.1